jgi:hypothetical protein
MEPIKPTKPVKNPIPMLMYDASKNIDLSSSPARTCGF